ncbi:hypothetical protein M9458_010289 [Cirrhinus mrigala]|uniref:Uncharacterized protein n=1 Tax=Cirrhinus mrigala TaxID=683832 RepID=A0ABD0R0F6_CIRMR
MGIALWCVWATYTTTKSPEVAAYAAEPLEAAASAAASSEAMMLATVSPEVAAETAEPHEMGKSALAPCMVVAPSDTHPACGSLSCPVPAMEAMYELSVPPVMAMETVSEPSALPWWASAPFAPPWRSSASSALPWRAPAPPWWASTQSAPPWWASALPLGSSVLLWWSSPTLSDCFVFCFCLECLEATLWEGALGHLCILLTFHITQTVAPHPELCSPSSIVLITCTQSDTPYKPRTSSCYSTSIVRSI